MPLKRFDRPIILGMVGDSASGKTTLAAGVARILGEDRVATICTDDYHRYSRSERAENGLSALDPRANYIDILEQDLARLRQGKPILKPVYSHDTGDLVAPEYIAPKPYIIVEGLLGYTTRAMRDCYDVKTYLEPDEDLRVDWKIQRDTAKRGYTREAVLASLEKRAADSPAFIHPQRIFADIVIQFRRPEGQTAESGARLDVRHILRPTLPHPNLAPLVDAGAKNELSLDLARDHDGKPVDVLGIAGSITDQRAAALQNLLWDLIPEASHLRANVGEFTNAENEQVVSHPLALTQLLIAYHMVKAALGIHAI
ncbi:phosphoribulokinase [Roseospira marina]|uniref:Phosphoribulokinase n=1 Tax=Roseospira marina TaxID=140057 RepID=A0A5M6I8F5_9PROT|nr:phosphoribulokinase [Roseospira marina]KAA5604544.1 phosphoribulokinase [Roseospira marina]MBB4315289.1 phosphoribulokinase [Roseospira marina]MBB5088288.1 phosphoribulokinase [Roseospira marina]